MALGRPHPCLGWLFLSGQEYRICFNKIIEMIDEQIKKGIAITKLYSGSKKKWKI